MSASPGALVLSPPETSYVAAGIRSALEDGGISIIDLDDSLFERALRAAAVSDAIYSADFIVVDVTSQNPNIMYELGLAQALRKPTILLAASNSGARLPGDLVGLSLIPYDPANLTDLRRQLQSWIKSISLKLSILWQEPRSVSS